MLEGFVGVVGTPVVAQALRGEEDEGCGEGVQLGEEKQMRSSVFGSIDGHFELYARLRDKAVEGHGEKRPEKDHLYAENRATAEMAEIVLITRYEIGDSGTESSRENGPVFLHEDDVGWNETNIDIADELSPGEKMLKPLGLPGR
jgi:hypothetical protein